MTRAEASQYRNLRKQLSPDLRQPFDTIVRLYDRPKGTRSPAENDEARQALRDFMALVLA